MFDRNHLRSNTENHSWTAWSLALLLVQLLFDTEQPLVRLGQGSQKPREKEVFKNIQASRIWPSSINFVVGGRPLLYVLVSPESHFTLYYLQMYYS